MVERPAKEPKKFNMVIYKRLLQYTLQEWKMSLGVFLFLTIQSITQVMIPQLMGKMLDATIIHQNLEELTQLGLYCLTIFVLNSVFTFLRSYCVHMLGEQIIIRLRNDCFEKFIKQDFEFHHRHKSSELNSRLTSDINTAKVMKAFGIRRFFFFFLHD